MDIEQWAQGLLMEVCAKWENNKGNYDFSESGFSVFYSPVRQSPELMIIGYNPGGDETSFCKARDLCVPVTHEYIDYKSDRKYPIAGKMYNLFENISKSDWLERSVKLNVLFFRSKSEQQWNTIKKDVRKDLKEFSYMKVKEIADVLTPKFILTEGIKTFNILTNIILCCSEKPVFEQGRGNRAIYARSRYNDIKIIGLIHPTGARVSNDEWLKVKEYLKKDFSFE